MICSLNTQEHAVSAKQMGGILGTLIENTLTDLDLCKCTFLCKLKFYICYKTMVLSGRTSLTSSSSFSPS